MDVIQARNAKENIDVRINKCEERVNTFLVNPNESALNEIISQLDAFDREVLEGDWGGYYEAFRRPLIGKLDNLRNSLGQAPPQRSEEVWTRPAPTDRLANNQTLEGLPTLGTGRPAREMNVVVVLTSTGAFPSEQCTICLDGFDDEGVEQGYVACGHRFHAACIRLWARQKRREGVPCPLCDQNLLKSSQNLLHTTSPAPVIRQAPAPVISQAPAPVINWECTMCTFENQHARAYCEVCNTPKQRAAGTGEGTKIPCSVCTYVNSSAHVFCEICQNPLHSEGNAGGLNVDFTSRPSEPWTCSFCTEHQDGTVYFCKFCGSAQPDETRNSAPINIPTYSRTEGPKWQCSACTIENSPNFLECQTCRTRRPNQAQSTGDEIDHTGIY